MIQNIILKIKVDKNNIKKEASMKIQIILYQNRIKKKKLWLIQKKPETGIKTYKREEKGLGDNHLPAENHKREGIKRDTDLQVHLLVLLKIDTITKSKKGLFFLKINS